jgi:hypothetical protein
MVVMGVRMTLTAMSIGMLMRAMAMGLAIRHAPTLPEARGKVEPA